MQITINQEEIEEAIKTYVATQGINVDGKDVSVSLVAGRGANGMSAAIEISPAKYRDDLVSPDPTYTTADNTTFNDTANAGDAETLTKQTHSDDDDPVLVEDETPLFGK